MKGLLKGLRYISNIFEAEEKEPEMQIGLPTDVKHVAHIGWDGPSVNTPSWMNEFKSASSEPQTGTAAGERSHRSSPFDSSPQDVHLPNGGSQGSVSSSRDLPAVPLPKPSRRNPPSASAANPGSPRARHSRRNPSSSSASADSPDRERTEGSRRARRERGGTAGSTTDIVKPPLGTTPPSPPTSPLQDGSQEPSKPQARRRKAKGTSSGACSPSSSKPPSTRSRAADQQIRPQPSKPTGEDAEEG